MSTIPARSGPTRCSRTDVQAARRGAAPRSTDWLEARARHRDARRARLRERLRAGDDARARAQTLGIRIDRRSRAPRAATCRSPATTNSSAGRNGRRSARPTAWRSASSGRCSRSSCTRRVGSGEVDVISAYTSDGRIAQYDLVGARRSEARHPALRRDPAGLAQARQRRGAARRAAAAGRRDRRRR